MDIAPFALERWFAAVEHDADVMLAESGVRPLPASRFDTDPGALGYVVPTAGDPAFRETVGALHDRGAAETLFTCGTQEANLLAVLALAAEHAVVVTPTYGSLTALPRALAEVTTVPLREPEPADRGPEGEPGGGVDSGADGDSGEDGDSGGDSGPDADGDPGWTLDPDAVADALRPGTDLVVLVNPNNPTGRYHDGQTVRAVYEACADNDTYLLCDEVYRLLAADPLPPVASLGPWGVSTAGVSKAFGLAGLRFGWLCGPEAVVSAAARWKDYTTISPPKVGQHVARQAIDRRGELLAENRALVADNRARVEAFLADHGLAWSAPDCGVNALVALPEGFDDGESFCRAVVDEESVVLAPGEAFGRPGWFRIGFGLPREELREGLSRVGSFLERSSREG